MTTTAPRPAEVSPWVIDLLVAFGQAVVVALVVAIGAREQMFQHPGPYLFAAGFGLLLLLRHRLPVTVVVVSVLAVFVYYAVGYPPIGMALPVVGALYSAAERGRVRPAVLAGGTLLLVSLYFRLNDGESSAVLAYDVITNAALIGCAIAFALTVRSRRALQAHEARMVELERQRQQERAARQLEAERTRIARDVHDSVGHALSLVSVQARVAQQSVGTDDAAVSRALDNVVGATRSSLTDLRRTLGMLRGDADHHGPTHAPVTLAEMGRTAQAARDAGLEVVLDVDLGGRVVPAAAQSTAYRIVQESVTNVLRHARARSVTIVVRAEAHRLRVRVADDGRGAGQAEQRSGAGIAGMRTRAELLGGTVTTRSGEAGFEVEADLPTGEGR
jgi:signal transduction histidine kinase